MTFLSRSTVRSQLRRGATARVEAFYHGYGVRLYTASGKRGRLLADAHGRTFPQTFPTNREAERAIRSL